MTTSYKILGQSAPSATTETTLYTVPSATETIVSTVTVCNRGTAAGTFRINASVNGATTANSQFIVYDLLIEPKGILALTLGITMDATDVLRVYASTADFSFSAFGTEIA